MEKTKNFKSDYIKFGIVLLFMFGFRFLPPIGSITPYGMAVLGIMIGAILHTLGFAIMMVFYVLLATGVIPWTMN